MYKLTSAGHFTTGLSAAICCFSTLQLQDQNSLTFYLSLPHPIQTLDVALFFEPQYLQYHPVCVSLELPICAAAEARLGFPLFGRRVPQPAHLVASELLAVPQ